MLDMGGAFCLFVSESMKLSVIYPFNKLMGWGILNVKYFTIKWGVIVECNILKKMERFR